MGHSFFYAIPALILPLIILGGIVFGVFTPTEAGIVAVIYAAALGFLYRNLNRRNIGDVFFTAIYRTSQVMLMTAAAGAFSFLLARSNFGPQVSGTLLLVTDSPTVLLILIVISIIVISSFLDALPAMLILTPVFYPLGLSLGFDPVHFAVVLIVTIVMGGLTPPVAPLLYIAGAIAQENPVKAMVAVLPFLLVSYAVVLLMIVFPPIVTFMPNLIVN